MASNTLKSAFLVIISLLATLTSAGKYSHGVECTDEFPHLEAGHILLTDDNWDKWYKDNQKLHVLGVSDTSCRRCCQTEEMLHKIKEKFDEKVFTGKKGKKL